MAACYQCSKHFTNEGPQERKYCSRTCRGAATRARAKARRAQEAKSDESDTAVRSLAQRPRRKLATLKDEATAHVPDVIPALDPAIAHRAALLVASRVRDPVDCVELLAMLGLLGVAKARHATPEDDLGSDRPTSA